MEQIDIQSRLESIKLLLLDVDGVLTDGKITYTDSGEEVKNFCSKDGLGLRLLMDSGITVGVITGRVANGALNTRCKNLGINVIQDGIKDKIEALKVVVKQLQIRENLDLSENYYSAIAYVGDDLPDIPIMRKCGLSFAVANASPEVKEIADYTTKSRGGDGAVREICEMILKAKGLWEAILTRWHY